MAVSLRTRRKRGNFLLSAAWKRYAPEARRPIYCLIFLFPLVATYEFGAILIYSHAWAPRQLVAQTIIQRLLGWFGARGVWLPAFLLLATLLIWHLLEKDSWRIRGWVLPLMALESVALTVPLFVLSQVMMLGCLLASGADVRHSLVLAIGAGVYEELVFRLYLLGGLLILLEKALRAPRRVAATGATVIASALFAACHFAPIGGEALTWRQFLLFFLSGIYLGLIFLSRGIGIAAGCHAAFNLTLIALCLRP
jgi:membrane protease YdiL (CAAX protease family)